MANREIAFSTFLKLVELSTPQKEATLRGFLRGGGFNYWRPLQQLAPDVAANKLTIDGIQDKMAAFAKGHQRKYNEHALITLLKWASRRSLQMRNRPEKLIRKFGNSGLLIRMEPELAFSMDGHNYLMHVWATNSPALSEETLSMGLFFLRYHFQKAGYKNWQFLIYDTVKNRLFTEINVLANALTLLQQQRQTLNDLWSKVTDEYEKSKTPPKDKDLPSHPTSP